MPQRRAQGLLFAAVPRCVENEHAREQGGLEDAEQDADGGEAGEVVAGGHEADAGAPEDEAGADELADGELGDEVEGGEFHGKVAKVEDGAEPGVFLALEVCVLSEAKDCGEA